MRKLLLLLLPLAATAAPPTITSITSQGLFHAGINYEVLVSVDAFCQFKYGLSSGVYTYSTGMIPSTTPAGRAVNDCVGSIGGLEPGTTYYVLPTAWPKSDLNSTTNLCQVSGCGAVEQVITTPAQPAIHPEPPAAPTTWTPVEPDTTGYSIVTLKLDGSGNCVVDTATGPKLHWAGSLVAGDDMQTILNNIWFQTAIQVPQGMDCFINQSAPYNTGPNMVHYTPDGGPTDWVVIETKPGGVGDLPPFGYRIDPTFANHLGIMRMRTPMNPSASVASGGFLEGNMFNCAACNANHYWFRNLEFQGQLDTTNFPTNVQDPPMYGVPVSMKPHCLLFSSVDCQPDDPATTPDYIVLDRIYMPEQPFPYRQIGCTNPGGNHWLIIGTYCSQDVWQPAIFPYKEPSSAGAVITIPYGYTQSPSNTDPRYGMPQVAGYTDTVTVTKLMPAPGDHFTFTSNATLSYVAGDLIQVNPLPLTGGNRPEYVARFIIGTVSSYNSGTKAMDILVSESSWTGYQYDKWDVERPNQITFSGANIGTYAGLVVAWLDNTGLVVKFETAAGVTASCRYAAGCSVGPQTGLLTSWNSVPATGYWYFTGSFNGAGSYVQPGAGGSYITSGWNNPSRWTPWRPQGVYVQSGRYGIYRNNYMHAIGQTIYADTSGGFSDLVFDKSYLYFPRDEMSNTPGWNGHLYMSRNIIELKECVRCSFKGIVVDGSMSQQNTGAPLYIAGSWGGTWSGGTLDWDAHSNIFKHLSTGIQCNGGGAANPPDVFQTRRLRITNNMFLDLNKDIYSNNLYQDFGPSAITGWLSATPGCADFNISNNTVGQATGYGPSIIMAGGDGHGPSVLGEGFLFLKNFMVTEIGQTFQPVDTVAGGPYNDYCGSYCTNYPAAPYVMVNGTSTWGARMNSVFLRAAGSVTPNLVTGYNILLPGRYGTPNSWFDMPQAGASNSVNWINAGWNLDSTTKVIQGNTSTARNATAGWPGISLTSGNVRDYTIHASAVQAGDAGANVDQVLADAGFVSRITVNPGASTITFNYNAPDTNACHVDVSPDSITWSRFTGTSGVRTQTAVATGLTPSTLYQYRVMCYFNQSSFMEVDADQITYGTVTTSASATRTVSLSTVYLPTGATQALVTYTPLSGSTVSNTCTSFPCSASLPTNTYTRTVQPQTSGAVSVGGPSVQPGIVVR
jgi:hypothetical protein